MPMVYIYVAYIRHNAGNTSLKCQSFFPTLAGSWRCCSHIVYLIILILDDVLDDVAVLSDRAVVSILQE